MFVKKVLITLLSSAMLISAIPAEAAFGRSSGSTPSRSFSTPSKSSSFSTPSKSSGSTSTGGISQGQSVGMSRSNVANSVKNGTYSAPANGTTVAGKNPGGSNQGSNDSGYAPSSGYNNNGYNNGGYAQQPAQSGHSTGTVLGAAAVAGAAGYMLGNHNSQPNTVVVNGQGQQGYNNGGYAQPNVVNGNGNGNGNGVDSYGNSNQVSPVMVAQQSGGGVGSFIWSIIKVILGLIVLAFLVMFIIGWFQKKNKGSDMLQMNSKTPEDEIRDGKEQFFINFQQNNRPSGLSYIRSNSDNVLFSAIEDTVTQSSDSRVIKVKRLEAELVDLTQDGSRYIASVRYNALVSEGEPNGEMTDTDIKELWNFVYISGSWKLAGIDQL
jgi:hypothetical protein